MWFLGVMAGWILAAMWDWPAEGMLVLAIAGGLGFAKLFGKKSTAPQPHAVPLHSEFHPNEQPEDDASPASPVDVRRLQRRVAELEQRLALLEQRFGQDAANANVASAANATNATSATSPASAAAFNVSNTARAASATSTSGASPSWPTLPAHAPTAPPAPALATSPPTQPSLAPRHPDPAQGATARAKTAQPGPAPDAQASVPLTPAPLPDAVQAAATGNGFSDTLPAGMPAAAAQPGPASRPMRPVPPPAVPLKDRLPAPIAEWLFGGNALVKAGVLILFLGLAFLLRYTAERVTVPIELRYAGVALVGAGLLLVGWRLRQKRAGYALILQGAGIGVFYLTTLTAMKVSGLLPASAGFVFLFGVTLLSAALAVLQNAPVLAIVAVLEGFAAPVLASTGQNRPVSLFSYLLVLDIGIALIARFKAWRVLNLIGFVGTFALAAAWAQRWYTDDQFAIVQPFLIAFFLLFTTVGLLFARRTLAEASIDHDEPLASRAAATLRQVGRVDSALVFGVPMAAFGLQYLLMRPWEYGAAFSALGLSAFYIVLGRIVFATQPRGLALLAEAYAIVGVIFGTLAIPLGLEGRWTGASWAVEAAGMYWLGARQARPYARAFSFVVLAGAAWKLLQDIGVDAAPDHPLLQGSVIGPLLLALSALGMWALHRRARLDQAGRDWETLAGVSLPWIGMAALALLPWQWWTPPWAACATAALASAAFGVAVRFSLWPLASVSYGMQALAVGGFVATLQRGAGEEVLASGWQGALAAGLIALSVLASSAWNMAQARRAALARGVAPEWSAGNIVAVLSGTGLLHLAMLFQLSLAQAAFVWPLSAAAVLWVALRMAHGPLAALAAALHLVSAGIWGVQALFDHQFHPAFAHLGFWTPVVLGLSALLAGDWVREQARPPAEQAPAGRWRNDWCASRLVLWVPVLAGLGWWLLAMVSESLTVLQRHALSAYGPAACVAIGLTTSALAWQVARWRDWTQLGRAITLATLPGLALVALYGSAIDTQDFYVPSASLGALAWPLAALWHLRLLRGPALSWVSPRALARLHVAGFWFYLLLAAREGQWQFSRLGEEGSSWPLLGWALVPALALWALRSPALLKRWPLSDFRRAYLEVAAWAVALYLLAWTWLTNAFSAGDASPLPYVPLLNPLELANWLVLLALALWWRVLPEESLARLAPRPARAVAGLSALALLTGTVLRACHHYAGVDWRFSALYASWLTQAALSLTWALAGVAVMVLGHRQRLRLLWTAGAALLGVVVLKLFLVELADQGGLFRIVSFIGVGALLLLVGYFAPVPPGQQGEALPQEEKT